MLQVFWTEVSLGDVSNGVDNHSLSANRKQGAMRWFASNAVRDLADRKRQSLVFRR
jgi:hypothetical protein